MFGRKKKKGAEPADNAQTQPESTATPHKLHTKKRKKTLLRQMKVQASVPSTVIDAIHHDPSVINSEKDYVWSPKLTFSDGDYYPIFVLDEDSMEDAGLGERRNSHELGQLSIALKTSSSSSGFVAVATAESLDAEFMGILPMHDAFEALKDFTSIDDYQPGWLVGLVRIDNDELLLTKTDLRLTMPEWWAFVNKKLQLVVKNDTLKKVQGAVNSSDPLAVDEQEETGGTEPNHLQQSASLPTGEFDDDDSPHSNSNIDNYVNSGQQPAGDSENGFEIPSLTTDSSTEADTPQSTVTPVASNVAPVASTTSSQPVSGDDQNGYGIPDLNVNPNTLPQTDPAPSNEPAPAQSVDNQEGLTPASVMPQQAPQSQAAPSTAPVVVQAQNNEAQNADQLQAQDATLRASTATLNDLSVSISDYEFIEAYLKQLRVDLIPLLDESNDPTGYRHHQNELRKQANLELKASLQDRKAEMKAWFEAQRQAILSVISERIKDENSEVKKQGDLIHDLTAKSGDNEELRFTAQNKIQGQLDQMQARFDDELKTAQIQAQNEVNKQFNVKRRELDDEKEQTIQRAMADEQQQITSQINVAKQKIRDLAQTAASKAYRQVMDEGEDQFQQAQHLLAHRRQQMLNKLDNDEKLARKAENERIEHAATIAKHDTTIEQLRAQLREMQANMDQSLQNAKNQAETQIASVQAQAETTRQNAVASVERDLKRAQSDRDQLQAQLDKQLSQAQSREDERDAAHAKELAALRNELKDAQKKTDRSNKHIVRNATAAAILGMAVFGGAGWLGGALHATNVKQNQPMTQQQQPQAQSQSSSKSENTQSPIVIQMPESSNGNNNNGNDHQNHSNKNGQNNGDQNQNSNNNNNSNHK